MNKFLYLILFAFTLASCGGNSSNSTKTAEATKVAQETKSADFTQNYKGEVVEVLYFHGKKRCITCNAIEKLTNEVINSDFSKELADKKILLKIVDISTKEGEKIADKYEVTWSSLFVNKWEDGKETPKNLTEMGFTYAKNQPEEFKKSFKATLSQLL